MNNPFTFQVLDNNWDWLAPIPVVRIGFYIWLPILLPFIAISYIGFLMEERMWKRVAKARQRSAE